MKEKFKKYLMLFIYTLKLSAFTFGGGFVIVSLMKKQFVDKLKWITEKEMIDYTAIAQSSPGAIAVNASILVGFHIGGIIGAATAVAATVLPPFAALSAISYGYAFIIDNSAVSYIMTGMQAGVAAVICDVVCSLINSVWKENKVFAVCAGVFAFVCVAVLSVNIILVIAVCAAAGIIFFGKRDKNGSV